MSCALCDMSFDLATLSLVIPSYSQTKECDASGDNCYYPIVSRDYVSVIPGIVGTLVGMI